MHVVVFGAGALGSVYGGLLDRAGVEVTLVSRNRDHMREIDRDGLSIRDRIEGGVLPAHPNATTDPTNVQTADVLLLTTKSLHTEAAIADARPTISEDTIITTMQNGLTNMDVIARQPFVGDDQVLGGCAYTGATLVEPGTVALTMMETDKIGGDDRHGDVVVDVLTDADIPAEAVDDPIGHIWDKQLTGAAFKPVAALTGLRIGELFTLPPTERLMRELVLETARVADAEGIELPTTDPVATLYTRGDRAKRAKPSMLQDIERGRPTEIDYINGVIAEIGTAHDIPVPHNEIVTSLVKGREASYLER